MSSRSFLLQLLIISLTTALLLFGLHRIPQLAADFPLSIASLLFFVALSAGMFFLARYTAGLTNRNMFTNVILGFTMLKMIASAGIVLGYWFLVEPTSKLFVLPFFLVYLIFTCFEIYFMIRLSRLPPADLVRE